MKQRIPKGEPSAREYWEKQLPRNYSFYPKEGPEDGGPSFTQAVVLAVLVLLPLLLFFVNMIKK